MAERTALDHEPLDRTKVRDLIDRWFEAAEKKDADALAALHTLDCIHISPKVRALYPETGGVLHGREAFKEWEDVSLRNTPGLKYGRTRTSYVDDLVFAEYIRRAEGDPDMPVVEIFQVVELAEGVRIKFSAVYRG